MKKKEEEEKKLKGDMKKNLEEFKKNKESKKSYMRKKEKDGRLMNDQTETIKVYAITKIAFILTIYVMPID